MWGRTILDKEGADIDQEVSRSFSHKPCLGDGGSNACLKWTKERYGDPNSLSPAFCQTCQKSSPQIKTEESFDHMEVEKHLAESSLDQNLGLDPGLEDKDNTRDLIQ